MAQTTPLSILVVDGERAAREVFARRFSDEGWSVATAGDRAQALLSFSANVPHCLVVERDLADGSGFSLFERLRTVNPDLSAVMMTLQPSITEAVRVIRAGFCDYRLKSLDCRDLLDPAAWRFGRAARPAKDPAKMAKMAGSLAHVEWNHIQEVLTYSHGNVSEAARVLGLHRRSLQRKLRRSSGEDRSDRR